MTRGELGKLLQARQTEVNWCQSPDCYRDILTLCTELQVDTKLLLLAIQKTAGFESLLSRRFTGVTLKTSEAVTGGVTSDTVTLENLSLDPASPLTVHTYQTVNLAPFKEIISQCFEPYLHIYLEAQDSNLAEMVGRFAAEAAAGASTTDPGAISAVLPSCGDLFVFYRACLVQSAVQGAQHRPAYARSGRALPAGVHQPGAGVVPGPGTQLRTGQLSQLKDLSQLGQVSARTSALPHVALLLCTGHYWYPGQLLLPAEGGRGGGAVQCGGSGRHSQLPRHCRVLYRHHNAGELLNWIK